MYCDYKFLAEALELRAEAIGRLYPWREVTEVLAEFSFENPTLHGDLADCGVVLARQRNHLCALTFVVSSAPAPLTKHARPLAARLLDHGVRSSANEHPDFAWHFRRHIGGRVIGH